MSDDSDDAVETEAADAAAEDAPDAAEEAPAAEPEAQAVEEPAGDSDSEAVDGTGVAAGDDETDEDEADAEPEGLQDGDFLRVAYTARTVEGDQLVDTTDEAVAEEEGVADQGTFEPRVIVLGEGHLFPAVEDDIRGREVGETGTVEVPAADAFGEYDEAEVETVSADKIDEDDRYPGAPVQIDGQQGVLETIVGGRARVDFNHPLAGDDVAYEYELLDVVEDDLERAEGLLDMFLELDLEMWLETDEVEETRVEEPDEDSETPEESREDGDSEEQSSSSRESGQSPRTEAVDAEPETVTETVDKRTLYVESDPQLAMNQQWMMQKQQIAQQIIDLTSIDRILIQEILDGSGMGMPGMMGGMGGAGGGDVDIEEALEEADIDADEIAEEL
ncbi:peptidylprolyl isomerase [Halobacteriales archaeon QS_1_69_70]|nr:MAG: peptidylprolyl isomerase [Halobacteriales archaeon QS_1_69_70]